MPADSDVVVVGAGIGGAVLALALGQRGWRVKLLEREVEPPHIVRPEILWGATPAALDRLQVGDAIRTKASVRLSGIEVGHRSRRLLTVSRHVLKSAGVEAWSTDPARTRQEIADAALATGNVSVTRGAEVRGCLLDGQRIVGVEGIRQGEAFQEFARLTVGDDGAQSIVRRSLGAQIDLKLFPLEFITAPINWPEALPPDRGRVAINPAAIREGIPALGMIPWPRGRGALLIPLPHERVEPLLHSPPEEFWNQVERLTPLAGSLAAQLRFPHDFKHVRRPYGHASQYTCDAAAILGDAAHPVSPAGGQGANASIWDALALAEVAHEALSAGDVSRQRLSRYETLRRPRNMESLRITELAVSALKALPRVPGWARLVPFLLGMIDSLPWLKGRILHRFATTFVTR